ncbi:MAG: gluconate 2-dehydrogenase subunit 3 family protein [Caulobacterales bacterium]|nr:gluconate 2-dehydrogenase subunit 3 family protein [Caulobacterales bacterium]
MLNRRGAILSLTAGTLAAGWAVPVVAAVAGPTLAWAPTALSAAQALALTAAAGRIVPTTETPGAVEAGVPQFVDRTLATWSTPLDVEKMKAGLTRLDSDARVAHGKVFAALDPAQQDALLTAYDAEAKTQGWAHFFSVLRELVTWGYFTSEAGATKALNYNPVPGPYRGCVPLKEIGRGWALL